MDTRFVSIYFAFLIFFKKFCLSVSVPRSVLITGANRGLGFEIVKQLNKLTNPPKFIFACCRDPAKSQELSTYASNHKNVHVIQLDVTDFASHAKVVDDVSRILDGEGLHSLINNAGVLNFNSSLDVITPEMMISEYTINAVGPLMLSRAFLPLLKKAASASTSFGRTWSRASIINMSAVLGSIERNKSGGLYPYRCSKVALNMITQSLSIDLGSHNILVVALHPGWVQTDMGGPGGSLTKDESISNLLATMSKFDESYQGFLVQHDGIILPF